MVYLTAAGSLKSIVGVAPGASFLWMRLKKVNQRQIIYFRIKNVVQSL